MLPAVTSTPLDPDWHPDGNALAYSMRGDIWVQDLNSDHALAVTLGPGYHFEPAWSPDGEWIALAVDLDGQFDIAVIRADGSDFRRLTSDPAVDVQPTWTPDGRSVVFASASGYDFDIRIYDLETGSIETLVGGGGPSGECRWATKSSGARPPGPSPGRSAASGCPSWQTRAPRGACESPDDPWKSEQPRASRRHRGSRERHARAARTSCSRCPGSPRTR